MHEIRRLNSELIKTKKRIEQLEKGMADNQFFRNIFNSCPVPYCLNDENGNIIALNDKFKSILGYDLDELRTLDDWWPKAYPDLEYRERVKQTWTRRLEKSLATNTGFEALEVKIVCKNGTQRSFLASAAPLTDAKEGIHLVILYDITDVKRAKNTIGDLSDSVTTLMYSLGEQNKALLLEKEKALASEERLSLAMQGANDGLWDWDLLSNKIYFSPRWKGMLGYAEDEIENTVHAWECLVHPEDLAPSKESIQVFLDRKADKYESEFRMQHKNGYFLSILSQAFAVESDEGQITRLVGTHVDITQRKQAEAKLLFQSTHDSLTGLVNRREFERRSEQALLTSQQQTLSHALCYIDLDQFKVVNDTCGHIAGDNLLVQLSNVLNKLVRPCDTLARLGGDEFGVLVEECSLDDAYQIASFIQTVIQDFQFIWEGRSFRISASMGLVAITQNTISLTELLKEADAACYMAKDKGRNFIHVHRDEDQELAQRQGEMLWVARIQQALDEGRFALFAQGIELLHKPLHTPLHKPSHTHYELLLRMLDEQGKLIPPGAFLPSAERYNLMRQIDRWVVHQALSLLKSSPGFLAQVELVSINLSGQSLTDPSFLEFVISELQALGSQSNKICFEITETAAISNLSLADQFVSELKQFGCRFALDDFGSGLSSFAYLKNLAVDYLKIDGMFVKDMVGDRIDNAMVKSINDVGKIMGMQTIAEFVENDEIKAMLSELGVDYAQGCGIHRPQAFAELLAQ